MKRLLLLLVCLVYISSVSGNNFGISATTGTDVGVTAILAPVEGIGLTAIETVTVVVKNFGTDVSAFIPVTVELSGPTGNQSVSGMYNSYINPGDSASVTLPAAFDMHLCGSYSITACSGLDGDIITANNCISKTVVNHSPLAITALVSPVQGEGLTSAEPLIISLLNNGSQPLSQVPIRFRLNNNAPEEYIFSGPLPAGGSATVNLGTLDMQLFGTYHIEICPAPEGYVDCNCNTYVVINNLITVLDTFVPLSLPLWTGSTNGTTFTQNSLIKFSSGYLEKGWAKFNINPAIPQGSTINSVNLDFYVQSETGNPQINLVRLLLDPLTSTPAEVYSALHQYVVYDYFYLISNTGWYSVPLGGAAKSDLMAQSDESWFCVGFTDYEPVCPGCNYGTAEGWMEDHTPKLSVHYTPPLAHDIGVALVLEPFIPASPFIQRASVHNYGSSAETFVVTLNGSNGYMSEVTISQLAPGASTTVAFDPYPSFPGENCLELSHNLASDMNFDNDHRQLCWFKPMQNDVFGTVRYKNAEGTLITDSTTILLININAPDQYYVDTIDSNGGYFFGDIPSGTYRLQVNSQKSWGGGNASDGLAIMKDFVGLMPLTGLNSVSADLNLDGHITSIDGMLVLKRFVSQIFGFPLADWVSEDITVTLPPAPYQATNIWVLCAGDVNGSFVP